MLTNFEGKLSLAIIDVNSGDVVWSVSMTNTDPWGPKSLVCSDDGPDPRMKQVVFGTLQDDHQVGHSRVVLSLCYSPDVVVSGLQVR